LPGAWKDGNVTGLRARGGFEIDMAWNGGRLIAATIKSSAGGICHVYYAGKAIMLTMKKGESVRLDGTLSQP
jgi:alpha-L-fucosidase 2